MKYFIITGTSRGLGEALALQLAEEGHHLFCVSRSHNQELNKQVLAKGARIEELEYDLSKPEEIDGLMERVFSAIEAEQAELICLVNNAGVVNPIKPIEKCTAEEIRNNLHVNLLAPMLLTAAFVNRTQAFETEKRVLNISSGAGKKPYAGWSSYCTAKAGLDMFTRCVGVEQVERAYPVKMLSLAPGVVDTAMQTEIRATAKEDFVHLDRFIKLKEEGQLLSPALIAEKISSILLAEQYGQGGVVDIRDFL